MASLEYDEMLEDIVEVITELRGVVRTIDFTREMGEKERLRGNAEAYRQAAGNRAFLYQLQPGAGRG